MTYVLDEEYNKKYPFVKRVRGVFYSKTLDLFLLIFVIFKLTKYLKLGKLMIFLKFKFKCFNQVKSSKLI